MSQLEVIDDLSPSMPSIGSWPFEKWHSTNNTGYYHKSSEAPSPKYDNESYALLDPILRPLCLSLHQQNILTTPSRSGSFYERSDLKQVWNQLKAEERLIRRRGLSVTNADTKEQVLFTNKRYQLPWNTFEDFEKEADASHRIGCLGIIVPENLQRLSEKLKEFNYSTSYTKVEHAADLDGGSQLFHVTVQAPDEDQQTQEWRLVTVFFLKLLNEK
tara:strand:+ start:489353 stop:490000 length:648 start_codon:yes stop_codon:yes gene_type:complete